MPMTIVEKILARASGAEKVKPGDLVVVGVDTVVLYDGNFFPAYWRDLKQVKNPDSIVVVFDHRVPAPDRTCAKAHEVGRAFVKQFGIKRFHDVGPTQGISHVIVAQHGYALPGTVLVCSDSHTGSGGAFNCAARGTGGPDMIYALAKGETWFRSVPSIRYDLTGTLNHGVSSKDLFLHIASVYGDHANHNVEFGGPALRELSIDARRTLATMGTELNADFTIFEPDEHDARLRPRAHHRTVRAAISRCRLSATLTGASSTSTRWSRWSRCRARSSTTRLASAKCTASESSRPSSAPAPTATSTISRSRPTWFADARSRRAYAS